MQNNKFDGSEYQDAFGGAKKIHQAIPIPPELGGRVGAALSSARPGHGMAWRKTAVSAAAVLALFIISVNASPAFAKTVYRVPVLGNVARVFTLWRYSEQSDARQIRIEVPSVSNTGHAELEARVNHEIQSKIDTILEESKKRSESERKAYLETGGKAEDFIPVTVDVNYEVKCSNESTLSFVINKTEVRASSNTEQVFYNIDLKTGKEITLPELLGKDYRKIADASITKQIAELKKDPKNMFFEGDEGFHGISSDQHFYINTKGNPVICFDKYAIAPGYMGLLEFEIAK